MANQTWTKTSSGNVLDTLGNIVGTGDGAGTITITSATVQVTNGNTLLITQGVTVKMNSATGRFLVTRNASGSGTLQITGTKAEPVTITSNQISPVPGDYNGIELLNTDAGSNPTVTASWMILEYASTGIFSVSGSQQCTVTVTDSVFRRIEDSHLQTAGIPAGTWSATRCVFDKCNGDQPALSFNNLIICAGSGTGPTITIDHCSITYIGTWATSDQEVFNAGPRGTITVRNSIFTGENLHPTREVRNAIVIAPGGVLNNDWNWYQTEGLGNWTNGANDQSKDPGYLDATCAGGNADLRPNYDTGVSVADEFGGLLGALEPYNVPVPPEPPGPPGPGPREDGYSYADFIDPRFVPLVCDYDFFTGDYPADWARALLERKETPSHRLVVCLDLPAKGIPEGFELAPGVPIPILESTADTITVDLGCWVQSMRPVRVERDVTFREYQGSDVDLVFMDWFGRLDPKIIGSLFHNVRWRGLRVEIGSWIRGTTSVLKHGRWFLQDITRRDENTVIRLHDWFLETLRRPLRANVVGSLSTTIAAAPNVGFDLTQVSLDSSIAVVEDWTVRFLDEGTFASRTYEVIGSVSGFQGSGSIDADFTTQDGALTIRLEAFTSNPANPNLAQFQFGDVIDFNAANELRALPTDVIYQYLTTYGGLVEGIDIEAADFLAARNFLPTQTEIHLLFKSPTTLLEACRRAALHGFVTLSASARGTVTLGGFKPTLSSALSQDQSRAICASNDLQSCETANLEIYNVIRVSYGPLDADGATHSGDVDGAPQAWFSFPTPELGDGFNRSLDFWGEIYPLPLELPGFARGQEGAVFALAQYYWVFFEGTPTARELLKLKCKLHDLNRDLEEVVWIESSRPDRNVWGQIVSFAKDPFNQAVELNAVDVSDIVQPPFGCGYAFCDAGHYTDDCWVCF